jgi:hypothetical protein
MQVHHPGAAIKIVSVHTELTNDTVDTVDTVCYGGGTVSSTLKIMHKLYLFQSVLWNAYTMFREQNVVLSPLVHFLS